jgi:two-component sensor histidine kinase
MRYHLLVLLILLVFSSHAQSSKSQIDTWNASFYETYDQDLDKAFLLAKRALKESKKINYIAGEGGALYRIGIYYDIKMKSDSARIFLFNGIEKLKKTTAYSDLGDAYNNLGAHYYYQFEYNKAISAHRDAIQYFNRANKREGISKALNNIGICYKNLGKLDLAKSTYKQSLALGIKYNDSLMISIANASISGLFIELKELDSALTYNVRSELFVPKNDNYTRITIWFSRGEIYKGMGQFLEAEKAYKVGLELAVKSSNNERIQYFYKSLAELKESQNLFKESIDWYKKYDSLRDFMYNTERNDFMAKYENKFKLAEKEQSIKQKNIQLLQAKNRSAEQQNKIQIGVIIILILIALSIILFLAFRLKRRNHEIAMRKLNETDLLSRELHHRIKNNLQLVSSLLTIELHHLVGNDKSKLLKVKDSLHVIGRLHETLFESKKWEKIKLSEILNELKNQSTNLLPNLKINLDYEDKLLDINAGISLGIVINELITNSMKHAFFQIDNPEITIMLKEIEGKLELTYLDNGIGFDVSTENSSFGSELLSALLKKIGSNTKITGQNGFNLTSQLTIQFYSNENYSH